MQTLPVASPANITRGFSIHPAFLIGVFLRFNFYLLLGVTEYTASIGAYK